MSRATMQVLMRRVASAEIYSPISVFVNSEYTSKNGQSPYNAVFMDTITTLNILKEGDPTYIGSYHRYLDVAEVKDEVRNAEIRIRAAIKG